MRFDPGKTVWLYAMLLPSILWGPVAMSVGNALVAAMLTAITVVLGHTVGLHRGVIHRTFRTSPAMRAVFVVLFAATGLGGPRRWLILHAVRDHWQSRKDSPAVWRYDHGLLLDAWWALHCSPAGVDPLAVGVRSQDLADPVLDAVDRAFLPIQLGVGALLWLLGGADLLVVGGCMRVAVVIVGHWFVGYAAHTMGSRRYGVEGVAEEGRNHWLLGLLSFGEGFHNNHHAAPSCARLGRHWSEPDLGWLALLLLERMGLVWDVHRPHDLRDYLRPGARLLDGA